MLREAYHGHCKLRISHIVYNKAQTPLNRFVVDVLYNKLYNKSNAVQQIQNILTRQVVAIE